MEHGDNLTGSLLLAHPGLKDPNFRRTVIFLSQHSGEEGAMGFILNRPLDESIPGLEGVPVHHGGPVDTSSLVLASLQWRDNPTIVAFRTFPSTPDEETRRGWDDGLRVFAGYAGWSAGQLEAEIAARAWIVIPPTRDLVEMNHPHTCWKALMRSLDPHLHLLAEAPDSPEKN